MSRYSNRLSAWALYTLTPYLLVGIAAPLALIDLPGAIVLCALAVLLRWLA